KIQELHDTIAQQRKSLEHLVRVLEDKEKTRQTLAEDYKNAEKERNSLQNLRQDLEDKLSIAEGNEKACRQKIEDLEKNNVLEKEELNKIINERKEYIQELKTELAKNLY